ncbi:MAG: hypothetical protein ABIG39_07805 [Candidatus Micrarchaeota archaeon]
MSETFDVLNKRWKNACRVVFREDVGELEDYLVWLEGLNRASMHKKSSISGKDITYAIKEYSPESKWISLDEVDFDKKYEPLNINEIKDIDSLLEAVSERVYYTGNLILGNSHNIERSSNVSDSTYIHNTTMIGDSRYLANCSFGRLNEDVFGTYGPGESSFCIRCTQTYRMKRCFELWMCQNCSDCYYCFGLSGCSECIFCFNVKSKRRCIGNLELEPSKYKKIKEKLLFEMVQELKGKKRLPSLLDIVAKCRNEQPTQKQVGEEESEKLDEGVVEREFPKTTGLVLGKKLEIMQQYSEWLERHTDRIREGNSVISGKSLPVLPSMVAVVDLPKDRLVTTEEAQDIGRGTSFSLPEAEDLTLANAHEMIGKLAYFNVEFREGKNTNLIKCSTSIDSSNSYRTSGLVYAKYCGYTFWPRSSEHAFGCHAVFDSSFCINCYYSVKLTRCFEMDSCRNCSDCYFCHNCENLDECMFCFNVKSKRYAVGNVEVGREEYLRLKKMVLGRIGKELEGKKDVPCDIYNLEGKK